MSGEAPRRSAPLLIYDGDCGFCRAWIARWQSLTGDTVEYAAFQGVADQFPAISIDQFKKAVHLVEPNGDVSTGAHAVFRALQRVPGRSWLLASYRHVPGFATACETGYRVVASHRSVLSTLTHLLIGRNLERPTYFYSRWLFLRLIGAIYLIAFASLAVQWRGLIGGAGILPAHRFLTAVEQHFGTERYWRLPTLCWLNSSDSFLQGLCIGGMALAVLQIIGVLQPLVLLLLWAGYVSLVNVGQDFLSFQWDMLLLEAGLLAAFFAPRQLYSRPSKESEPPFGYRMLVYWLLFRLVFLSGATKLTYHDTTWRGLTALTFHYETQPLPVWASWYVHHLPLWFHKASCAVMFIIEIVLPILIFGPRRGKHIAFFGIVSLMILIGATGNYTFFNLLAVALCIPLLDDAFLRRVLPRWLTRRFPAPSHPRRPHVLRRGIASLFVMIVFLVGGVEAWDQIGGRHMLSGWTASIAHGLRPFRSINGYGLFRVMTTSRPEIVIEGSDEGLAWREYEFRWKPGDVKRAPGFVQPHQPRLDWQMWFAALAAPQRPMWFDRFILKLLEGSPEVLGLLGADPFPAGPPRYIRAKLYDYHFTTREERAGSGAWWKREIVGMYLPMVSSRGGR